MGYLNELLARNPLVIDGDTIKPHHKYTDDLYTGGKTKMTNYDRIKSMSVEEVAEFIDKNYKCRKCAYYNRCCNGDCTNGIIQWLLQEVSENE